MLVVTAKDWVFQCGENSTQPLLIYGAGRLAAAAIPALPIRNRRRDGEAGAGGVMAELSSMAGLMVDIVDLLEKT